MTATLDDIANGQRYIYGVLCEIRDLLKQSPAQSAPVSDADLDGQYGNPEVKKDPPRWKGDPFVGHRYSECTPEYLDEMAGFQTWTADRDAAKPATDEDEKKKNDKNAWYARQRAGYARGWAARLRAGWKPPASDW